jgi:hypothetical protein
MPTSSTFKKKFINIIFRFVRTTQPLVIMKRSHVVLSMCAIFFACGLGVIVATVALSPTLGLGNATEVLVVENIKGGCAGCGLLIHSGTSPIQSSGILSIVNLGAAIILLSLINLSLFCQAEEFLRTPATALVGRRGQLGNGKADLESMIRHRSRRHSQQHEIHNANPAVVHTPSRMIIIELDSFVD